MKKSFNSTLVLLVVFAGLLAWYLLYERKYKTQQTEKEEQAKVLLTTPRDAVQELTVEQRQGDDATAKYRSLVFKKTGSEWHLTAPVDDLADNGAINGLINAVTGTKYDRIVDEKPADLEPFGLKTPKLKIAVKKNADTPAETLLVGNDVPVGAYVYVKIEGKDPVYRAAQSLRTSFDKDVAEYRNKKVLDIARGDVSEMEIRTAGESFVLKKTEEGKWLLAREGLPAAETEVNKTLGGLVDLVATAFASEKAANLATFGLAPASATVTFKKKDGQALVLLGKVKDKYYVKRGDKSVVFEIAKDAHDKATRPAKDYRDLKLAHFNRFEVKRIKVEHGDQGYELVKDNSDWKLATDSSVKVDNSKVDDYLSRLQDTRIGGFGKASEKPKKADIVVHLFEKKGDGEAEVVTLKLAKTASGAVGERNGLDASLSLKEADFKRVNAFKQEFLASDKKAENKPESGKS